MMVRVRGMIKSMEQAAAASPDAPTPAPARGRAAGWLPVLATAIAYFAVARAYLDFTLLEGLFTPVWLASGVALGSALLLGPRALVGVFVGDLATSLWTGIPIASAVPVALGDVAEAFVVWALVTRFAGGPRFAWSVRRVVALSISVPLGSIISASVAVATFRIDGSLAAESSARAWLLYATSTTSGMLLGAPFIVAAARARARMRRHGSEGAGRRAVELAAQVALGSAIASIAFLQGGWMVLLLVLLVPLSIWCALRGGMLSVSSALLAVTVVGAWALGHGHNPLFAVGVVETTQVFQLMIVSAAVASLVLVALLSELDFARGRRIEALDTLTRAEQLGELGSWALDVPDHAAPAAASEIWCSDGLRERLEPEPGSVARVRLATLESWIDDDSAARLDRFLRDANVGDELRLEHHPRKDPARTLDHRVRCVAGSLDDPTIDRRFVGSLRDVTRLRDVAAFQNSLVATASHELRTPITSILGFATTLRERWDTFDPDDRDAFLEIIGTQAHRLTEIVDDTLTQSRVDSTGFQPKVDRIDLATAVREAIALVGPEPDVTIDPSVAMAVVADPAHLPRIIGNLIGNARKYGAAPITVSAQRHGDDVRVLVTDHGPGVPDEFVERMFERFTRGADVRSVPGTGLGLSIVRGLVEAAGGSVGYERVDDTTVFWVQVAGASAGSGVRH